MHSAEHGLLRNGQTEGRGRKKVASLLLEPTSLSAPSLQPGGHVLSNHQKSWLAPAVVTSGGHTFIPHLTLLRHSREELCSINVAISRWCLLHSQLRPECLPHLFTRMPVKGHGTGSHNHSVNIHAGTERLTGCH